MYLVYHVIEYFWAKHPDKYVATKLGFYYGLEDQTHFGESKYGKMLLRVILQSSLIWIWKVSLLFIIYSTPKIVDYFLFSEIFPSNENLAFQVCYPGTFNDIYQGLQTYGFYGTK